MRGQLGALHIDVSTELEAPWTVLFGASGSGKSTLLRALCGLLPSGGSPNSPWTIHISRRDASGLWTTLAEADSALPAHLRGIAYAPQAPSLFPHLSVGDNVRFGLASQRDSSSQQAAQAADQACELFELRELWSRRPAELSGGEQQRVNLARAFARPHTHLLLLDEPFTGMDRALRDRLLARLRSAVAARAVPVLSVTHDVEEAFLLQAEVLRLEGSRLVDRGPASQVLAAEAGQIRLALEHHDSRAK